MVKSYNFLEGSQTDINRRLLRKIEALENSSSTGYDDTEIKADITDLKTAVGDNTKGLTKKVTDVEAAIGDESTEGSILARIKSLEDAT